ncbi:flavodoxin domain-containing protein [Vallitalea guaymasensis]|uniref:flavodoxin domain-containing protein n=1 Tax=Vallitalea guaymasensis TaxID=1185412 RepID=UPI002356442E|nr:flavodoxin domain-containing protein [Vallitalea guaymasensis]
MSVLIVFSTKYGFTEKCIKVLRNDLQGEVKIVNIQQEMIKDISCYDKIIIGGPIYVGRFQKKLRRFCADNLQILLDKKIGLFVTCSVGGDIAIKQLNDAFPSELCRNTIVKGCFGGEINKEKARFFHRLIVKMVSKTDSSSTHRNNGMIIESINEFAGIINSR